MTDSILDADGQPPRALYYSRAVARQIQEMLGLVKGLVCDGDLSEGEILSFRKWLDVNPDATARWPGYDLARRESISDGHEARPSRHLGSGHDARFSSPPLMMIETFAEQGPMVPPRSSPASGVPLARTGPSASHPLRAVRPTCVLSLRPEKWQ